nr:MAG TPA: hypothetical protein [Caudoviricetes sp.]
MFFERIVNLSMLSLTFTFFFYFIFFEIKHISIKTVKEICLCKYFFYLLLMYF